MSRLRLGRKLLFLLCLFYILLQYYISQQVFDSTSSQNLFVDSNKQTKESFLQKVCSKYSLEHQSAGSIWRAHQSQIFTALQHPQDLEYRHANWTRELLQLLTPSVLNKSLRTIPTKVPLSIRQKLGGWTTDSKTTPRPIKILVFGGSIVEGSGCNRSPALIAGRAKLCATRLTASVVPRVNTISRRLAALMNPWILSRAPS